MQGFLRQCVWGRGVYGACMGRVWAVVGGARVVVDRACAPMQVCIVCIVCIVDTNLREKRPPRVLGRVDRVVRTNSLGVDHRGCAIEHRNTSVRLSLQDIRQVGWVEVGTDCARHDAGHDCGPRCKVIGTCEPGELELEKYYHRSTQKALLSAHRPPLRLDIDLGRPAQQGALLGFLLHHSKRTYRRVVTVG